MGREPEPAILWLEKPSILLPAIRVALVVGTIAVLLCLFRFVYRFVKKPATTIMDHHLNPWSSMPSERPYVLECGRDSVAECNAKYDRCRAEKYRLRTDVLPEPFIGRIQAPVVLLNLNPGFSDENVVEHARPEFPALLHNSYSQVSSAFPFCYLDPTIESFGGAKWWSRKLKGLIYACGRPRKVVNGLLCIISFSPLS